MFLPGSVKSEIKRTQQRLNLLTNRSIFSALKTSLNGTKGSIPDTMLAGNTTDDEARFATLVREEDHPVTGRLSADVVAALSRRAQPISNPHHCGRAPRTEAPIVTPTVSNQRVAALQICHDSLSAPPL
ncbi:ATP-dependent helicase [Sesbania bispinosa]|nr:ATP-dependent helicase [Sesbania bispinosa]